MSAGYVVFVLHACTRRRGHKTHFRLHRDPPRLHANGENAATLKTLRLERRKTEADVYTRFPQHSTTDGTVLNKAETHGLVTSAPHRSAICFLWTTARRKSRNSTGELMLLLLVSLSIFLCVWNSDGQSVWAIGLGHPQHFPHCVFFIFTLTFLLVGFPGASFASRLETTQKKREIDRV